MPISAPAPDLVPALLAWRGGEPRAGDRFFRAVGARLRSTAEAVARRSPGLEAEDLLHDAFVAFLRHRDAFDVSGGDGAVVRWFRLTLERRARDLAIRARRQRPLPERVDREVGDDGGGGARRTLGRAETATRLRRLRAVAGDRALVPISPANRTRLRALLDRVDRVVLGGAEGARSSGDLASSVGWTPFQIWNVARRLRVAVGEAGTEVPPAAPPQPAETPLPCATPEPPAAPPEAASPIATTSYRTGASPSTSPRAGRPAGPTRRSFPAAPMPRRQRRPPDRLLIRMEARCRARPGPGRPGRSRTGLDARDGPRRNRGSPGRSPPRGRSGRPPPGPLERGVEPGARGSPRSPPSDLLA